MSSAESPQSGIGAGRRRFARLAVASVLTASTLVAVPGPAAAAQACTERNGWVPQGVVAPAVPGVTDLSATRFADLDGDGDDDRLLLDVIGGVRAWRNDRNGAWAYRGRIAAGAGYGPDRVKFGDLNGDGRDDYFVVKDNGALDGWINEGGDVVSETGFTPGWRGVGQIARGTGAPASQITFADLDGDGDDDFTTQTDPWAAVLAWRNEGGDSPGRDGWVSWGQTFGANGLRATSRIGLADADCDGRDDMLILLPSSTLVVSGNGGFRNGSFVQDTDAGGNAAGTNDPIDRITFADLNGDGRFDYLVMKPDGTIQGYLNAGGDRL